MLNHPKGKIEMPKNNATVVRHFQVEGKIKNLQAGQHLFVVVEIDGLMWPKGEVQVKDTAWTCDVYEGGNPPNGRFVLSLFSMDGKGYEDINAWLERGKSTGDYPGLGSIEAGKRLHSIKLRIAP